jgi:hypothetical protein
MTRRDDPTERYRELGSAGVPWGVDMHVSVLVQDAPALESKLHDRFADRRVTQVNRRKEWFHVTIDEIRDAILELYGPCEFNPNQPCQDYEETIDYYEKKGSSFHSDQPLSNVSDAVISGIPRDFDDLSEQLRLPL